MTSKGQITIPANLPLEALKGMIKRPDVPVTIEQMNEAIAQEGMRAK